MIDASPSRHNPDLTESIWIYIFSSFFFSFLKKRNCEFRFKFAHKIKYGDLSERMLVRLFISFHIITRLDVVYFFCLRLFIPFSVRNFCFETEINKNSTENGWQEMRKQTRIICQQTGRCRWLSVAVCARARVKHMK